MKACIVFAALLNTIWNVGATTVLSIDFGNNLRFAVLKTGSRLVIDVLLNSESSRISPISITIDQDSVYYHQMSQRMESGHLAKSFSRFKSLVGKQIDSPETREYQTLNPETCMESDSNRTILFRHPDHKTPFSIEELCALLFGNIKEQTEEFVQEKVDEVVIVIPPHFDSISRQAILDAAEVAGLWVLELVHDTAAAAYFYSLSLTLSPSLRHFVFCDIGQDTTSASLVGFHTKDSVPHVDVLYSNSLHVGGFSIDLILQQWILEQFRSKHPTVNTEKHKDRKRLLAEANKIKLKLGMTTEYTTFIESLFGGHDLEVTITRAELEDMCQNLVEKVGDLIEDVMQSAGFGLDQIEGILLVGGGARSLFIQEHVKQRFKNKLAQNLNLEEGMVLGGSMRAASLSTKIRVKNVEMTDRTLFSFFLQDGETRIPLFPKLSPHDTLGTINLNKTRDFSVDVYQENEGTLAKISVIAVTRVETALGRLDNHAQNPLVQLMFRLDRNGMVKIEKGLLEFHHITEAIQENTTNDGNSTTLEELDGANVTRVETIQTLQHTDLKVTETNIYGCSDYHKQQMRERMVHFKQAYERKRDREGAMNMLEALSYKVLNMLDESFVLPEERSMLEQEARSALEKLEKENSTTEEYRLEWDLLNRLVEPVQKRHDTYKAYRNAIQDLKKEVEKVRILLKQHRGPNISGLETLIMQADERIHSESLQDRIFSNDTVLATEWAIEQQQSLRNHQLELSSMPGNATQPLQSDNQTVLTHSDL